jgi:hypothetical protein
MLECGDVLKTWRLAALPESGETVRAEAAFDHRPFYLDYEGPVSGNRGQVKRWDGGTYRLETPPEPGPVDVVTASLEGERWRGRVLLSKTASGAWWLTRQAAAAVE